MCSIFVDPPLCSLLSLCSLCALCTLMHSALGQKCQNGRRRTTKIRQRRRLTTRGLRSRRPGLPVPVPIGRANENERRHGHVLGLPSFSAVCFMFHPASAVQAAQSTDARRAQSTVVSKLQEMHRSSWLAAAGFAFSSFCGLGLGLAWRAWICGDIGCAAHQGESNHRRNRCLP